MMYHFLRTRKVSHCHNFYVMSRDNHEPLLAKVLNTSFYFGHLSSEISVGATKTTTVLTCEADMPCFMGGWFSKAMGHKLGKP